MNSETGIARDLQLLLRDRFATYEQLEVVRLLHRNRAESWTASRIAEQLKISVPLVRAALDALCANSFLETTTVSEDTMPIYTLARGPLSEAIVRIVEVYEEQPIEIIKLMSANAIERVKTAALRALADAFVVRRKNDDG